MLLYCDTVLRCVQLCFVINRYKPIFCSCRKLCNSNDICNIRFLCSVFMPFTNIQSIQNIEHWDKFIVQAYKHTCPTFIYIKALSFSFSNFRLLFIC